MPDFKDAKGDVWNVTVTGGTIKRAQEILGVDLGKPLDGKTPLLTEFDTNIQFKVDVLYVAVKPQADERNISDEAFAERLEGEALYAASQAFLEAWAHFFQSLRRPEAEAIRKEQAALAKVWEVAKRTFASEKLDAVIDGELEKLETELAGELDRLGSSAANSQA